MKAKRLIQIVVAGLLGASALANDIAPGKEYYTAIKAANPIVLDGDLSELRRYITFIEERGANCITVVDEFDQDVVYD